MKIRKGFVSNSSSSSFIIAGHYVDPGDYEKFFRHFFSPEQLAEELDECSQLMCCGQVVKTAFCPKCGKKKEDVVPEIKWDWMIKDVKNIHTDGEDQIFYGRRKSIGEYCDFEIPLSQFIAWQNEVNAEVVPLGYEDEINIYGFTTY